MSRLLDSKLDPIITDIQSMKKDIAEIKENQEATNEALNELIAWTEAADARSTLNSFLQTAKSNIEPRPGRKARAILL